MAYKRELIAKTKNLFDSNNIDTQWLGIQYKSVGNGKILLNGAKEGGLNIFSVTRPNITLPAGSYTLSCRMLAGNIEGVEANFNKKIYFGINGDSYTYRCEGVGKVGDYATKTFTLTEDTLLKTFDITAGYTNGFNINNVMIECQLEKGSTATDYVPYGYLTSYKKLLKVSDVCQLLDKSKYPATQTINGVTFTNNGDGIVTLSGTSTKQSAYILIERAGMVGHKYLVYGCPAGDSYTTYRLTASIHKNEIYSDGFSDSGNGNISKVLEAGEYISIIIDVKNISDANLVFKPQLFDLTEMYGAGNEPATVDEFRAKFPNDLYDYSPRCWVKSYKTGLIAKTKNLFDISKVDTTTTLNVVDNTISAKNPSSDPSSWTYNNSQYKTTLDAGRYFLSFDNMSMASSVNESTRLLVRDDTNTWIAQITDKAFVNNKVVMSFTLDKQTNIGIQLKLYTQVISNFQIEKGSTATEYTPYGYL